jgi:hypothetical protein
MSIISAVHSDVYIQCIWLNALRFKGSPGYAEINFIIWKWNIGKLPYGNSSETILFHQVVANALGMYALLTINA